MTLPVHPTVKETVEIGLCSCRQCLFQGVAQLQISMLSGAYAYISMLGSLVVAGVHWLLYALSLYSAEYVHARCQPDVTSQFLV